MNANEKEVLDKATSLTSKDTGFFTVDGFSRIKEYLKTAGKNAKAVIGTTMDFCNPDPHVERRPLGMKVKVNIPAKKELSMEEALSETKPGHADLVNKLMEEESHDE